MPMPESTIDNETHKNLWNIKIETDHPIQARCKDQVFVNKKKLCQIMQTTKQIENGGKDKYLRPAKELWNIFDSHGCCYRTSEKTGVTGNQSWNQ